jgi:hypothetical protein
MVVALSLDQRARVPEGARQWAGVVREVPAVRRAAGAEEDRAGGGRDRGGRPTGSSTAAAPGRGWPTCSPRRTPGRCRGWMVRTGVAFARAAEEWLRLLPRGVGWGARDVRPRRLGMADEVDRIDRELSRKELALRKTDARSPTAGRSGRLAAAGAVCAFTRKQKRVRLAGGQSPKRPETGAIRRLRPPMSLTTAVRPCHFLGSLEVASGSATSAAISRGRARRRT